MGKEFEDNGMIGLLIIQQLLTVKQNLGSFQILQTFYINPCQGCKTAISKTTKIVKNKLELLLNHTK